MRLHKKQFASNRARALEHYGRADARRDVSNPPEKNLNKVVIDAKVIEGGKLKFYRKRGSQAKKNEAA